MRAAIPCLVLLALLAACRNADGGGSAAALVPNAAGMNGCSGPAQVFTAPQTPAAVALLTFAATENSALAAAGDAELLYATGANATVVSIDVSGATLVEEELVSAGTVAALLALSGIADPPELGAVAVLDLDTLLVQELTSNTLLSVDRTTPNTLGFWAGEPNPVPGFADGAATGSAGRARFSFTESSALCPTGETPPRVFVADVGNHAVRVVADGSVSTIAGGGTALFNDGSLAQTFFDTPTGLTLSCSNGLVVSERGANGFGHRLRTLTIGAASPFGGFFGDSATLAGDGTAATTAGPSLAGAELDAPVAPFATSTGELYWIDSGTGVLRRRATNGTCDCPLAVDCATAVGAPEFPAGHRFALAETPAGVLYVLDATDDVLWRVTP
ncbi:MAG: hypothetical protein HZA53_05995 [Planctomycetes bacterium]|nr:hypothetical protein [Planctomycetota bacterium]